MTGQFDIHQKRELLELLFDLREGILGPPQAERLEAIVMAHTEAQQIYVEWMNLRAGLHRRLNGDGAPVVPEELVAEEPVELQSSVWETIRTIASNNMALSVLVSAIVMTNLLLGMALIRPGDDPPAAVNGPSLRDVVAKITNSSGAAWDASSHGNFRETSLLLGDHLVLNSGLAEITFATGAQVTLEGPAEFMIGSGQRQETGGVDQANAGYLQRGALLATCETPEAQGFAIATPHATVIDRGTVFAVTVGGDDNFSAHVIEGRVELHQANQPVTLTAGQAAVISSEGVLALESAAPRELQARFARFKLAPRAKTRQVVNVDLGADANARYVGLAAAPDLRSNTYWNAFGRGQRQTSSLLASDGKTQSGIGFVSGASEAGRMPEQRIDLLDDYHFHWARNGPFTLMISGLSPESTYDVYLYASSARNQGAVFSIGDQTKQAAGTMLDRLAPGVNFVQFAAVSPTADGQLVVTVAENGQAAAMLNGFQIVELTTAGDDRMNDGQ